MYGHWLPRLRSSLLGMQGAGSGLTLWCDVTGSSRLYHGCDRWRERWKRWIKELLGKLRQTNKGAVAHISSCRVLFARLACPLLKSHNHFKSMLLSQVLFLTTSSVKRWQLMQSSERFQSFFYSVELNTTSGLCRLPLWPYLTSN